MWLSRKNPQIAFWHITLLKLCAPHSVLSLLDTSTYTSTAPQATSSKRIIQFNQHLSETVSTKTQHYNLHRGRIDCRTVVFGCSISFSYVYLNWQLLVLMKYNMFSFWKQVTPLFITGLCCKAELFVKISVMFQSEVLRYRFLRNHNIWRVVQVKVFHKLKFVYSSWRIQLQMWKK